MISDQQAKNSLVELVKHVGDYQGKPIPSISYQELATRIGRIDKHGHAHAHGMGPAVLGKLGYMLKGLEVGWGERIPQIQCLVGVKNDPQLLPDEGIREFWPDYSRLTPVEKQLRVNREKDLIAQYGSRWNNVLNFYGIPPVRLAPNPQRVFGAGGESTAHRELKEFVRDHPALFAVDNRAERFTEFVLPSLDAVDVLFKEQDRWTAVEVKSAVSDGVVGDYERGIYQVIKYAAILSAMQCDRRYGVPKNVRVFLVLESSLPASLKTVATALQLNLCENVRP